VILTKEFLGDVDSCLEGYRFGLENNLIDNDYDAAIKFCAENGHQDFANWLIEQKTTEKYVRANGSVIIMGAYQVFNPLTGLHTKYETEAEAKSALIEVAQAILNQQCPKVIQEISNENGDTTWIPTNMNESLVVS
jgi:hypothetical protein